MKKITFVKHLSFFIALFCAVNFGFGQSQIIISQYIETNSGSTPKGIEIYNVSGSDIVFSPTNNLQVYWGNNGATCINLPGTNITTGTLLANEVWVIGTTDLVTYASTNGLNLSGILDYTFIFNGDDALQLYLGGILQDAFGTCGSDPGTSWSGSGVSTANNNLQIIDGLCNGETTGWTDPSTRFTQIANGSTMTGFGNAPALCCVNASTWTSSGWSDGTPTINTSATIDYLYNTGTNGSFKACSLTINPLVTLTVNNGTYVEVENDVNVSGEIYVDTQGAFVQNDDSGSFNLVDSGTASVYKETAAKQEWYYYTYWSSPVEDETVDGAFPFTSTDRRFLFNASIYLDINGDGIDDVNGWQIAAADDPLIPGVGYAATAGPFHIPGATDSADFIGAFNTGDIPTSIFHNPSNPESWNLIGNPYPCAIDFNAFYDANSSIIEGVAYYWSQASLPDAANPGNEVLNFSQNDYAMYSYGAVAGVMGASGVEPTPFIPSAQSFFVEGKTNDIVTFTNAMRMADGLSNNLFFKTTNTKSKATSSANKLWINLTSDNGVFCQTLIAYVDGATNGNDGATYDAPKLPTNGINAVLYSTIDDSNKNFAIQCKDVNSINEDEVINLGFKTTINVATLYKLSVAKLQGAFLTNSPIYLIDNLLNKVHDLSVCDYTFTSAVGEFNSRFEIAFTNKALSVNDVQLNTRAFKIVELQDDLVQFNTNNNLTIKAVNIYDLLGRELYRFKGENTSETYRLSNLNNTVYIAKVALSDGTVVTKKAVKK